MLSLHVRLAGIASILATGVASQQIWDIWQTTWDRSRLFTSVGPPAPINFVQPGPIGEANIVVDDGARFQEMLGFGASLTDSSATVLNNLKNRNSGNYWNVMRTMFNPDSAGLNYIRVPIGASDFSASSYSLNDVSGDTSMSRFDMGKVPSQVISVLRDIQGMNNQLKVHLVAWSPPGWMKSGGSMNGGSLLPQYSDTYALYLLKSVQGFRAQGFPVHAVSVQNEPQHTNPTYPTCSMTPDVEARIAVKLRSLLDSNGLGQVKVVGYDHNWNNANSYPVDLVTQAGDAVSGVAFHCYEGPVSNQASFQRRFPNKDIYFTECTGTYGSDWWSDIKWYMDNLWIGSVERFSRTGLMWNIALDGAGNPKLPGTTSCGGPGCRPLVTVNNDGSYTFNQEFYAMAQASKAVTPKDPNGPFGQRIGVSVEGSKGWALRATAFATRRSSPGEWTRYSMVVLNWDDSANSGWNPKPVRATISFRGMQATYVFPVGVTTLWWYAPG
ncbi:glycosyl hydrolase family 30 [Coprinopsis cinerea AmutBmut pab1-1]|uniref:GH30A endo-beta-1,6-glucanase n=1 Tax=Coprinopsis cinerea TaxID=5346 RepID=A0A7D5FSA5_COPCI|nr:glycosyl hydrolase family 30 [Coprinopsis cinerea AmutBmut pab1-1]QLF98392.1 GH30A endo-beta-1,6-glucanase [Coprinopsis cinerea]